MIFPFFYFHNSIPFDLGYFSKVISKPLLTNQEYAGDGLRTLVLAYKDLDNEYLEDWKRRHHEASISMEEREEKLDQLYEEIEKDLLVSLRRL